MAKITGSCGILLGHANGFASQKVGPRSLESFSGLLEPSWRLWVMLGRPIATLAPSWGLCGGLLAPCWFVAMWGLVKLDHVAGSTPRTSSRPIFLIDVSVICWTHLGRNAAIFQPMLATFRDQLQHF